jgi:hypothetical protein
MNAFLERALGNKCGMHLVRIACMHCIAEVFGSGLWRMKTC